MDNDSEYISTFSRSLSLVLEEFYKTINYTAVSSKTGEGFQDLLNLCKKILEDYMNEKEKSA